MQGVAPLGFVVVKLGGPEVRMARSSVADVHEGAAVFMYRDSSMAPLLDLRRRLDAVMDVLDAMIRNGVSLARSVELTVQWKCILWVELVPPISLEDLESVQGVDLVKLAS